jgi:AP2 domain/HNH endonuclease
MVKVTQDRLKSLYEYNPATGIFTSRLYNKSVGFDHRGYLVVELWHEGKQRKFKLHQLAWMYVHGRWPQPMIDHINGIRIDNLREVTMSQNAQNKPPYKTNSGLPRSGFKGVHWIKASSKWRAAIGHKGKTISLGTFDDPEKAFLAYKEAAEKLHTHNEQIR